MGYLTEEAARKIIGKYIDCNKRVLGYYPMKVIEINGGLYLKDRINVCMLIPKTIDFNCHWYDYVFDMIAEEKPCQTQKA